MVFPLKNKTVVITGGTSGIGRALVDQLHSQNQLIVIGRSAAKLDTLKTEYPTVSVYRADLAVPTSLEVIADRITEHFPHIDVLINNAAVQYTPLFTEKSFKPELIAREIAVNLTSPALLISLLLPALTKDTPSAILNVNSGLGIVPKKSSAIYCGSKGGLNIFSQSLRHQLKDTNISVLQAFMPMVDTPMTEGRGSGKITAEEAAKRAIRGVERLVEDHDIGVVKILRALHKIWPQLASSLMNKR